MTTADGSFTVKEILVDLRDVVYKMQDKLDRIDREGSIGQRAELDDHELRLREVEKRPIVTRQELHDIKGDIVTINLWRSGLNAVARLKRWQISVALGGISIAAGLVGSIATLVWLNHG